MEGNYQTPFAEKQRVRYRNAGLCLFHGLLLGIGPIDSLTFWASLFAVLFSNFGSAFAFCPEPNPPRVCTEFFRADAVFIGTVSSVTEKPGEEDLIKGWTYSVKVDKNYRGAEKSSVEVFTANNSGRFLMKKDHRYLLFPIHSDGILKIYGCGNSTELSKANESIQQIDKILKEMQMGSGGDIAGRVLLPPRTDGDISGIVFSAKGNGSTYSGITDNEGSFHIVVPAGQYSVQADSKRWVVRGNDFAYQSPDHIEINHGGCTDLIFQALPSEKPK